MNDPIILGLKACDTCRKALKEIPNASLRDIRAEPLTKVDIVRYFDAFGDDLVNRRSTTWRGLSDADRARDPVDLLLENPTLMKRPVIEAPGGPYLGWNAGTKTAVLGSA
ncbi:MAG: ArsC/Spx/MgsR family protein [Pseudomonadota bacterium]